MAGVQRSGIDRCVMRVFSMETMMIGPKVTISKSCDGCECETVEHYAVQGDSGCHVNCTHPAVGMKRIGNDTWRTPDWCPVEMGDGETAKPHNAEVKGCGDEK